MSSRILLIEPDHLLGESVANGLGDNGWLVQRAYTAQEALNIADQNVLDLVICELQLVDHSGIEFLYEFKSYPEWQAIPVIIYSIVPPSEFSRHLTGLQNHLGVAAYLYKPRTTLRQLNRTVSGVLNKVQNEAAKN